MVAPGKGILAADESAATAKKRALSLSLRSGTFATERATGQ